MRYAQIVRLLTETPWAILPDTLELMSSLVAMRLAGERLSDDEIRARLDAVQPRAAVSPDAGVAVLPLYGPIAQRMGLMGDVSGGTSTEAFARGFRDALADPQAAAILIHVDSPGGNVYGVDELSREIYDARGTKPIVAIADSMAASAAYWIATAADELVVTPGGDVGSIGVFTVHQDLSRAYESLGVMNTILSAGKYKAEGSRYQPLADEARSAIQERVNDAYDMFVRAVARNRGVSPSAVRDGFGQGRMVAAKRAVEFGMADRVATMRETMERLSNPRTRGRSGRRAEEVIPTDVSGDSDRRRRRLRLNEATNMLVPTTKGS